MGLGNQFACTHAKKDERKDRKFVDAVWRHADQPNLCSLLFIPFAMTLNADQPAAVLTPVKTKHRLSPLLTEPWLHVIGIVILALLFSLAENKGFRWPDVLLGLISSAGYWEGNRQLFFVLRRRIPGYERTTRRILLHIGLSMVFIVLFSFIPAIGDVLVTGKTAEFWFFYRDHAANALFPTILITAVYESAYFFQEARRHAARSAQLEKENVLSRYEALKQQVDPHFLFNSLNIMAALIGNNKPAQEFLSELVDIYRYVLMSKNSLTVPLAEEMAFVNSYIYLNKIRFRDQIQLTVNIPASVLQKRVPPISVQMLIENAIKHNAASTKVPLRIAVSAGSDYLRVTNNTQPKTTIEKETKQGLQNITNRFRLLTNQPVVVDSRDGHFSVTLPLLTT